MDLLFLGILSGFAISYFIFQRYTQASKKSLTEKQSVVLLDKIKKVVKLITVEGEFAEIYHHQNTKEKFLGFLTSKKKAIILIKAKVFVGFDFQKIKMQVNTQAKTIVLSEFPNPEVFSVEPDISFYDIQNGMLNKFNAEELSQINKQAKEHILQKVTESNLMQTANKEALEAIRLMNSLAETIRWKLNYDSLELPYDKDKITKRGNLSN
ncbi:MAG: DUF4230 domain-containing protein [Tenacibaculum sp.]